MGRSLSGEFPLIIVTVVELPCLQLLCSALKDAKVVFVGRTLQKSVVQTRLDTPHFLSVLRVQYNEERNSCFSLSNDRIQHVVIREGLKKS